MTSKAIPLLLLVNKSKKSGRYLGGGGRGDKMADFPPKAVTLPFIELSFLSQPKFSRAVTELEHTAEGIQSPARWSCSSMPDPVPVHTITLSPLCALGNWKKQEMDFYSQQFILFLFCVFVFIGHAQR